MTETAALGFASTPGDENLGHCGVPFDMVEVRLQSMPEFDCLAEDYILVDGKKVSCPRGEIHIRVPANMKSYFNNPEKTAETLTSDGWLMTGDLGRINPNGTISIIGRTKNQVKLAKGEYVSLEKLEGVYGQPSSIEEIWIYVNSYKNAVVAVITPKYTWTVTQLEAAKKWTGRIPRTAGGKPDIADPSFRVTFAKVCEANREWLTKQVWENIHSEADVSTLKHHEKLPDKGTDKKPCIPIHLETEINHEGAVFNVINGCRTPSFKLRRKKLKERYLDQLKALYTRIGMPPKEGEKW